MNDLWKILTHLQRAANVGALYLITKKDYRNVELTPEEAEKLPAPPAHDS